MKNKLLVKFMDQNSILPFFFLFFSMFINSSHSFLFSREWIPNVHFGILLGALIRRHNEKKDKNNLKKKISREK